MTASTARRADSRRSIAAPAVDDMIDMYVKRNPDKPKKALARTGRVAAALGAAAAKLSGDQQEQLIARRANLAELIAAAVSAMEAREKPSEPMRLEPRGDVEIAQGTGLGERLDSAEGRRRLEAYASPTSIEDWAGAVAGATELERIYGIRRSTLHEWHKRGAVVGLLRGTRKHVFPLAQFVDGRPVEGVAKVSERISGGPRSAWLWLVTPHGALRGVTPLQALKSGRLEPVLEAADRDFSRP